ncbi:nascent polypeptide-associated complex subunit alpha, muscle-specific form-like [Canis lupus dingo]|uniref:nascent polypeptide-associated complex subunit alpha, muscle-specific form-like n=1 Tax=Canis lupus dingo TaxID=286419 RepID=UPI0020C2861B|nr:nascent polypeptide-associated complex subunit alpha, muscle-specific form-like [Canis lupus dingo]
MRRPASCWRGAGDTTVPAGVPGLAAAAELRLSPLRPSARPSHPRGLCPEGSPRGAPPPPGLETSAAALLAEAAWPPRGGTRGPATGRRDGSAREPSRPQGPEAGVNRGEPCVREPWRGRAAWQRPFPAPSVGRAPGTQAVTSRQQRGAGRREPSRLSTAVGPPGSLRGQFWDSSARLRPELHSPGSAEPPPPGSRGAVWGDWLGRVPGTGARGRGRRAAARLGATSRQPTPATALTADGPRAREAAGGVTAAGAAAGPSCASPSFLSQVRTQPRSPSRPLQCAPERGPAAAGRHRASVSSAPTRHNRPRHTHSGHGKFQHRHLVDTHTPAPPSPSLGANLPRPSM